ncbi:hypothetical protein VVDAL7940_04275 [Vibrio vulnificus]|nr:hypothetical protein VVDAL7940_04275 [Vibrio vulnificus]
MGKRFASTFSMEATNLDPFSVYRSPKLVAFSGEFGFFIWIFDM